MSLRDYEHWNEDALHMWWMEEGRHVEEPPDQDPYEAAAFGPDDDDWYDDDD